MTPVPAPTSMNTAHNGRKLVLIRLQVPTRGLFDEIEADELVLSSGGEVAQILAPELVLWHVPPETGHFVGVQSIRVVDGEDRRLPIVQRLGLVKQLTEQVDALGCADEQRPAFAVREGWLHDLVPDFRLDLRHFRSE